MRLNRKRYLLPTVRCVRTCLLNKRVVFRFTVASPRIRRYTSRHNKCHVTFVCTANGIVEAVTRTAVTSDVTTKIWSSTNKCTANKHLCLDSSGVDKKCVLASHKIYKKMESVNSTWMEPTWSWRKWKRSNKNIKMNWNTV